MSARLQVLIVAQAGRLEAEALLFAASWQAVGRPGDLIVASVQPGALWPDEPRISAAGEAALRAMGARICPLHCRHFGHSYPQGNKIEALGLLEAGRPFVFFDSDTVLLHDPRPVLDGARAGAMERVEPTWPKPRGGGPGRRAIWRALYDRFGMTMPEPPPYFCAARFHGPCPQQMHDTLLDMALEVRRDPPVELQGQALTPWLDQIVLPLALQRLGGGPDSERSAQLDHHLSWHYRSLALAQARAPDHVVQRITQLGHDPQIRDLLLRHPPFRAMLTGPAARDLRHRTRDLRHSPRETPVRKRLRKLGHWDR